MGDKNISFITNLWIQQASKYYVCSQVLFYYRVSVYV